MEIVPGERVASHTGGGGGYGDPLARDPEAVAEDVREGWVSRERALSVYGVTLRPGEAGTLVVDEAVTRARRACQV
jgi:N-methylhydantoinase B